MVAVLSRRYNAVMSKVKHISETPATQFLRRHKGRVRASILMSMSSMVARKNRRASLGVDEHCVVKTLVMEDEHAKPLIVLMHGDKTVSTKNLARADWREARRAVQAGSGQSAFRVLDRRHIAIWPRGRRCRCTWNRPSWDLDTIYLNGGRRGYLVSIAPPVLTDLLKATPVSCASVDKMRVLKSCSCLAVTSRLRLAFPKIRRNQ